MTDRKDPFEGFEPTTPTELALWHEIGRLTRITHDLGVYPALTLGCTPYNDIEVASLPPTITLPWGARVVGSIKSNGYLQVRVQARFGRGEADQFAVQYMVQPHYQSSFVAANHAMHLHKTLLHQVAEFLTERPSP